MVTAKDLISRFKAFDMLGRPVSFTFEGRNTYRTYTGTIVTLIVLIVTLIFAVRRFAIAFSYSGSTHSQFDLFTHYTLEDPLHKVDS